MVIASVTEVFSIEIVFEEEQLDALDILGWMFTFHFVH